MRDVSHSGAGGAVRHGTYSGYNSHKCRCVACRAYNAEQSRAKRARNPERLAAANQRGLEHGTWTALTYGCSCPECGVLRASTNKVQRERITRGEATHTRGGWNGNCKCDSCRKKQNAWRRARNAVLVEIAYRWGQEWTSAELDTVISARHPDAEIARRLGRTIYAVRAIRARALREPKLIAILDGDPARKSDA